MPERRRLTRWRATRYLLRHILRERARIGAVSSIGADAACYLVSWYGLPRTARAIARRQALLPSQPGKTHA